MDHVLTNLSGNLTTESVAQMVNCTGRTLSRKFINETAMTLGQFIHRGRILRAMELLAQSDMTVLEIVYAVGLNSMGSFETSFRKIVQESPLQYRKRFVSGSRSSGMG
jgi:transcriptional regulator GlxA family with amidase domain